MCGLGGPGHVRAQKTRSRRPACEEKSEDLTLFRCQFTLIDGKIIQP